MVLHLCPIFQAASARSKEQTDRKRAVLLLALMLAVPLRPTTTMFSSNGPVRELDSILQKADRIAPVLPLRVCSKDAWTATQGHSLPAFLSTRHPDRTAAPAAPTTGRTPRVTKSATSSLAAQDARKAAPSNAPLPCSKACGKVYLHSSIKARLNHEQTCKGPKAKKQKVGKALPAALVELSDSDEAEDTSTQRVECAFGCGAAYLPSSVAAKRKHEQACGHEIYPAERWGSGSGDASRETLQKLGVAQAELERQHARVLAVEHELKLQRKAVDVRGQADLMQLGVNLALQAQAPANILLNTAIAGLSGTILRSQHSSGELEFAQVMSTACKEAVMSWKSFVGLDLAEIREMLSMVTFAEKVTLRRLYRDARPDMKL